MDLHLSRNDLAETMCNEKIKNWLLESRVGYSSVADHSSLSIYYYYISAFSETFMFAICCLTIRPCCLSVCLSVMFVHPTQPVEIFGNVSMPFGTLAIR